MKREAKPTTTETRPEKVLLQMAIKDGDWAGIAIRFETEERHRFSGLWGLVTWLFRLRKDARRPSVPTDENVPVWLPASGPELESRAATNRIDSTPSSHVRIRQGRRSERRVR